MIIIRTHLDCQQRDSDHGGETFDAKKVWLEGAEMSFARAKVGYAPLPPLLVAI